MADNEGVTYDDAPSSMDSQFSTLEEMLNRVPLSAERSRRFGGRRPKYTRELAISFLTKWVGLRSLTAAAREAGVHRSTIYRWAHERRDFRVMFGITRRAIQSLREDPSFNLSTEDRHQQKLVARRLRSASAVPASTRRRGAEPRYRPDMCNLVGGTWAETAANIGVHRQTVANWCRQHPEFARAQFFASTYGKLRKTVAELEAMAGEYLS